MAAPTGMLPTSHQAVPGMDDRAMRGNNSVSNSEHDRICRLVLDLSVKEHRENALSELSKRREIFVDLAPILWHSFGTIAALLQEIVYVYPQLSPPTLTAAASNRVCHSLALLQCIASHPETRACFLQAHVPLFLYPFLNTVSKSRPFEHLRLTSLGVIGALVKVDDADVVNFLLQTEIIPLCLRIMETGSELSKTVATFIVQKVLLDDMGLNYVCATAERFYAVSTVLTNMLNAMHLNPSVRLLKHIVRCYLRLSDNHRAREALRECLPEALKDGSFTGTLKDDIATKRWLQTLLYCTGITNNEGVPVQRMHDPQAGRAPPGMGPPPAAAPGGYAARGMDGQQQLPPIPQQRQEL